MLASGPLPWLEIAKLAPPMITAITAVVGVAIAVRGLDRWRGETIGKRKAELAEEVLADFYRARDIYETARHPFSYSGEGNTRKAAENETESERDENNVYYVAVERLNKHAEFFAQFDARRYRFMAVFGRDAGKPYEDLRKIHGEIFVAARMLLTTTVRRRHLSGREYKDEWAKQDERWEAAIWGMGEQDQIAPRIESVVQEIERICRPAIEENAKRMMQRAFSFKVPRLATPTFRLFRRARAQSAAKPSPPRFE